MTIAYDGAAFHGWQKQEPPDPDAQPDPDGNRPRLSLRTVQSVVEQAVREVVREPLHIQGASRTDSGVHARHQTAAFSTSDDRRGPPDARLHLAINSRLPDDVLVRDVRRVADDFQPISDCLAKGYVYRLWTGRDRPLWCRGYVHHVRVPLDAEAMTAGAAKLVGTHDFTSFAAMRHGRESTVRTVYGCSVEREDKQSIRIRICGNGFLYNMVRIVAGTLVEIGRRRRPPESIDATLAALDRRAAGPTLPAQGLCLDWAYYAGDALGGFDPEVAAILEGLA